MCFVAALAAFKRLALLVRCQLGFTAEFDAARLGAGAALAGASADQLTLELREAARLLCQPIPYRGAAARLPPSTVANEPVVLRASARLTNAVATSSAVTSCPSRLRAMYCVSLIR
jgi:hypothetical protein